MKQLIREGSPSEMYDIMEQTFYDIGKCGTPALVHLTNDLFGEVTQVTKQEYMKGEGTILRRKLDELATALEHDCWETGCMLPKPRPVPLTIGERLAKLGLEGAK